MEALTPGRPRWNIIREAIRAVRMKARREIEAKILVRKIELDATMRTTPCVAGGVLYVTTEQTLYAIGKTP